MQYAKGDERGNKVNKELICLSCSLPPTSCDNGDLKCLYQITRKRYPIEPEKNRETVKKWYAANREKKIKTVADWVEANRARRNEYLRKRYAKLKEQDAITKSI